MDNTAPSNFKIAKKLESLLAQLSSYYAQQNNPLYQKLIVNCRYYLEEYAESMMQTDSSGFTSPIPGHAIHLALPQLIYSEMLPQINQVKDSLRKDINFICETSICDDEYICRVYIEMQENEELLDWRKNSGVLIQNNSLATVTNGEELYQIWDRGFLKVFLSHKSEDKLLATELKKNLSYYGVSCFVAHEDIEPTKEWLTVIEKSITTADVLLPLLTESFYDSQWTEQEIGIAIGRGIVIIPIKLGIDPHGFIGKYQAVPGKNKPMDKLAEELFKLMYSNISLKERVIDAVISQLESSQSFRQTNALMPYIATLTTLPMPLLVRLENAFKHNFQVNGAAAAEDSLPKLIEKWKKNYEP